MHFSPKRRRQLFLHALVISCLFTVNAQGQSSAGSPAITKSVIAGGGGTSASGASQVNGTLGQTVVGTSTGGSFKLEAGFWPNGVVPTATVLSVDNVSGTYGGSITLKATLSASGVDLNNKLISFTLNGTTVGTATTGADGVATLNSLSLSGTNAGTYPGAVTAQFAGDTGLTTAIGAGQLTVEKANPVVQVAGGIFSYDGQPHPATASVTGVNSELLNPLAVLYNGSSTVPVNAGTYSIAASFAGNQNYNSASNNLQSIGINRASQTISFGALSNKTFNDSDFNVSASASSGLLVSFSATGHCSVGGNTVHLTGAGACTITASQAGDSNYNAATSVPQTFSIAPVINGAPDAVDDALTSVSEDSGLRVIAIASLLSNDTAGPTNESNQTLTFTLMAGSGLGGTVTSDAINVYFTSAADFNGPAGFQYSVTDNGKTNGLPDPKGDTATASFLITEVNDAPMAGDNPLGNMEEDAPQRTIPFSLLTGNDSKGPANESAQTLIVKTVSNPVGLTVSIVAGTVRFTPLPDYSGPASFKYAVEDNGTTNGVADPKTSGQSLVHFNITAVADTPLVTNATTNAHIQTTSGLVISRNPVDGAEVTHFKITGTSGGALFKNDGVTPINNGDFITFAEGNAGLKFTAGTTNGSFAVQAATSATEAGLSGGTALATITVNPLGGLIRFIEAHYSVPEGAGSTTITVERTGDTSQAVTVDYASSDHSNPADFIPCTSPGAGFASSRCDFSTALGTLRFAAGETSKTFNVLISQDNELEGPETLELTLSNPTGGAVFGVPSTSILSITDDATEPATNPVETSSEFVRSQYHDFLNREPDAPGLAFWTDNIEKCNDPARRPLIGETRQTAAECIDKQRESTAVAFFSSPEFQMTGGFVYRLYKGSLTGAPNYDGGSPESSLGRLPTSLEFMRDVSQVSEGIVVNNRIDGAVVEANRDRLVAEFVRRPEFTAKYGRLNDTLYVQELFNTAGIAANAVEKQVLVDGLTNGTETRASVLRKVLDGTVVISEGNVQFTSSYGQAFINQENRRLFVFMEYVGYLRRNPDTAGFIFWLGKLNFYNGDRFQAEMVRSFILSPEYRSRFGRP